MILKLIYRLITSRTNVDTGQYTNIAPSLEKKIIQYKRVVILKIKLLDLSENCIPRNSTHIF